MRCHSMPDELEKRGDRPRPNLMKHPLSLALLTALFISACGEPEPPPQSRRVARYQPPPEQYPPVEQPFNPANQLPTPPPEVASTQPTPAPETAATAAPVKPTKGDI